MNEAGIPVRVLEALPCLRINIVPGQNAETSLVEAVGKPPAPQNRSTAVLFSVFMSALSVSARFGSASQRPRKLAQCQ